MCASSFFYNNLPNVCRKCTSFSCLPGRRPWAEGEEDEEDEEAEEEQQPEARLNLLGRLH